MLRKILYGGTLNTLAQGIYRLGILLLYVFAAKSGADYIAQNSTAIVVLVTFHSVGVAGLSVAASTFVSRSLSDKKLIPIYVRAIIFLSVKIALVVFFVAFAFFDILYLEIVGDVKGYQSVAIYVASGVFLLSNAAVLKGFFYAYGYYKELATISLVSAFSLFVGYSAFAGSMAIFYSYFLSVVVEFLVVITYFLIKIGYKSWLFSPKVESVSKEIRSFIVPASLASLVLMPINFFVLYLVGKNLSTTSLAAFNVGMQVRNFLIFIPSSFSSVLLKFVSELRAANEKDSKLDGNIFLNIALTVLSFVPIATAKFLGLTLLQLLGWDAIALIMISAVLYSYNISIGVYLTADLKVGLGLIFNCIWGSVYVSSLYLILSLNDYAYAPFIAINIAYLVLTVIQWRYAKRNYA